MFQGKYLFVISGYMGWQTFSMQNSPSLQFTPLQSTSRNPSGNTGASMERSQGSRATTATRKTTSATRPIFPEFLAIWYSLKGIKVKRARGNFHVRDLTHLQYTNRSRMLNRWDTYRTQHHMEYLKLPPGLQMALEAFHLDRMCILNLSCLKLKGVVDESSDLEQALQ